MPLGDLRATLKSLDAGTVRRVELLMPLPFLVRVEILDTPGFNAPDPQHTAAARSAFEEAGIAIWLLDATQAMKQSERAILDEAKKARVPVQMLVNKADRLAPDDLARVMASVEEGLSETGLVSWSAPLALSAKKALAAKLGDGKALAESGWPAAQSLLDEGIVARSDELKERALRRRASRVVAQLEAQASSERTRQKEEEQAAAARAQAIGHTAVVLSAAPMPSPSSWRSRWRPPPRRGTGTSSWCSWDGTARLSPGIRSSCATAWTARSRPWRPPPLACPRIASHGGKSRPRSATPTSARTLVRAAVSAAPRRSRSAAAGPRARRRRHAGRAALRDVRRARRFAAYDGPSS